MSSLTRFYPPQGNQSSSSVPYIIPGRLVKGDVDGTLTSSDFDETSLVNMIDTINGKQDLNAFLTDISGLVIDMQDDDIFQKKSGAIVNRTLAQLKADLALLLANITDVTITVGNLNSLDDGVNSTLHFHDSDRSRANHTGTQTKSTISDFAHATTHKSGGSDSIKLDELAAPTDITTLDVSTSAHGLMPKLVNDTHKYFRSDGAYSILYMAQTELDFGSTPIANKKFTVTDSNITDTMKIMVSISYDIPTGGVDGDAEAFEGMTIMASAGTGQCFIYCSSPFDDLDGKVKVNYMVSA